MSQRPYLKKKETITSGTLKTKYENWPKFGSTPI